MVAKQCYVGKWVRSPLLGAKSVVDASKLGLFLLSS